MPAPNGVIAVSPVVVNVSCGLIPKALATTWETEVSWPWPPGASQKKATENIFNKKKIPYRSFYILKKDEEQLGVLFTFFVLETILLSKFLKINPFDQPAVENIKKTTKNILLKI